MDLLEAHLNNGAKGRSFYTYFLNVNTTDESHLVGRCNKIWTLVIIISMDKYMLDDNYKKMCKDALKQHTHDDGLVDSLQVLLKDFNQTNVAMSPAFWRDL